MKLLFLGTGAADWPNPRTNHEGFYRRYSSTLIDDVLLIDPGPMVLDALEEFNINPANIKFILYTHKHSDHYSEKTVAALKENGAQLIDVSAETTIEVGPYTIHAIKGNHAVKTHHYIIDDGKSKVFYGLDGAFLLYEEVQTIIKNAPINLAILDATVGFIDGDYRVFEHNNLAMVLEIKKSLSVHIEKFCISHMACTLHEEHTILSEKMQEYDIITAYDGFVIQL